MHQLIECSASAEARAVAQCNERFSHATKAVLTAMLHPSLADSAATRMLLESAKKASPPLRRAVGEVLVRIDAVTPDRRAFALMVREPLHLAVEHSSIEALRVLTAEQVIRVMLPHPSLSHPAAPGTPNGRGDGMAQMCRRP